MFSRKSKPGSKDDQTEKKAALLSRFHLLKKDKPDPTNGLKPESPAPPRTSVESRRTTPRHESIIKADQTLKESIQKLEETCRTSKTVRKSQQKFGNDWLQKLLQREKEMNDNAEREPRDADGKLKPPPIRFEAALVEVIGSKAVEHQSSPSGRIASTFAKIYPIAEVALGVAEAAVESLEFPGAKFAFQAVTVIFTVTDKVGKDAEKIQETLENFVDYSSTIASINEARIDPSQPSNVAILKNTLLLYAKLLDFLKGSLEFYDESALKSGVKAAFDASPVAANQEALVNAYANLGHSLDHAYTGMRLRRQQLKADEALLNSISELNFETVHEQVDSEFIEGTGQWVLDNALFKKWLKKERVASTVLCCYGTVGAGKTFLTARVIDYLTSRAFQASNKRPLVAYIYCSRSSLKDQTPTSLVRNIIRQLVEQTLLQRYDEDYRVRDLVTSKFPTRSYSLQAYVAFLELLLELPPAPGHQKIQPILVIDAVNELLTNKLGANNRQPLLDAILALPLRILLTGNETISGKATGKAAKVYNLTIRPVEADVSRYIRYQIANSGQLEDYSGDDAPNVDVDRIIRSLWVKYSDNFSLIAMQMARITTATTIKKMRDIAEKDPKWGQDEMFNAALKRILNGTEESMEQARKIMAWVLFTPERRSLKLVEIQHALAFEIGQEVPLPSDSTNQNSESELVAYCAGFITTEPLEKTITFAHNQVRSFLEDEEIQHKLFGDFDPKRYMAETCLEYLCDEKVFKPQPLQAGFVDRRILEEFLKNHHISYPFAEYAEDFWPIHAKGESERRLEGLILKYLDKGPPYKNSSWLIPNLEWTKSYQNTIPRFNTKEHKKCYRLFFAVYNNLEIVLNALKVRGDTIDVRDNFGWSVLHTAAAEGHLELLRGMISLWPEESKALVSIADPYGYTALHIACNEGYDKVAEVLLDLGADFSTNGKNQEGNVLNGFYYAVFNSLEGSVIKMLQKQPGIVNMSIRRGETALHVAAKMDNQFMVKLLLKYKGDVAIQDDDGSFAFNYSKDPVIRGLLAEAAYELLKNMPGKGKQPITSPD